MELKEGMTLISASGTIGRTVYCRPEMAGMWSSEDVMKIVPNPKKILPGYLFSFLKSRFGRPLVLSGTYGAIIQHIEPEPLHNLPVPRLDQSIEKSIHAHIDRAARLRTEAAALRALSLLKASTLFQWPTFPSRSVQSTAIFEVNQLDGNRFDALHYNPSSIESTQALADKKWTPRALNEICRVFTPNIFKRHYVPDPAFGYPYLSGSELFEVTPECRGYLRKSGLDDYIVHANWLLIQDAGQLDGLIGQTLRVPALSHRAVVSNHLMRLAPHDPQNAGYIFAILTSDIGYRAILRHAFGTSIPQLDQAHIGAIQVPWPSELHREDIGRPMKKSWEMVDQAHREEQMAIDALEVEIVRLAGIE